MTEDLRELPEADGPQSCRRRAVCELLARRSQGEWHRGAPCSLGRNEDTRLSVTGTWTSWGPAAPAAFLQENMSPCCSAARTRRRAAVVAEPVGARVHMATSQCAPRLSP